MDVSELPADIAESFATREGVETGLQGLKKLRSSIYWNRLAFQAYCISAGRAPEVVEFLNADAAFAKSTYRKNLTAFFLEKGDDALGGMPEHLVARPDWVPCGTLEAFECYRRVFPGDLRDLEILECCPEVLECLASELGAAEPPMAEAELLGHLLRCAVDWSPGAKDEEATRAKLAVLGKRFGAKECAKWILGNDSEALLSLRVNARAVRLVGEEWGLAASFRGSKLLRHLNHSVLRAAISSGVGAYEETRALDALVCAMRAGCDFGQFARMVAPQGWARKEALAEWKALSRGFEYTVDEDKAMELGRAANAT